MANLILASKREVKSGAQMWHVYRSENNVKSEEFYFSQVGKAVRYMFLLRKRSGGIIPKAVYQKIMADYQASKAQAEPQQSAPQAAQEPSQAESEQDKFLAAFTAMCEKHPNCVLLYRRGDFYVAYAEQAKIVSEVCGVTLTHNSHVKNITEQQAAFPADRLDDYLPRLVRSGQRVAICDDITK